MNNISTIWKKFTTITTFSVHISVQYLVESFFRKLYIMYIEIVETCEKKRNNEFSIKVFNQIFSNHDLPLLELFFSEFGHIFVLFQQKYHLRRVPSWMGSWSVVYESSEQQPSCFLVLFILSVGMRVSVWNGESVGESHVGANSRFCWFWNSGSPGTITIALWVFVVLMIEFHFRSPSSTWFSWSISCDL